METQGLTYHLLDHAPETPWKPDETAPNVGTIPALWVTNPGWGVFSSEGKPVLEGSGLIAFIRALKSATHCRLSQQDLGSTWSNRQSNYSVHSLKGLAYQIVNCKDSWFNLSIVDNLAEFILRDRKSMLEIALSTPRISSYSNNVDLNHVFTIIGQRMAIGSGLSKKEILDRLQKQVVLKNVRLHEKDRPNHAKFWMLDDLIYVGSENLYPSTHHFFGPADTHASLQEFGVIVDAPPTVKNMILNNYFIPMFAKGKETRPQDSDMDW